ncbi:MAG: sialidase family protein [Actinomycetota bacterium]
MRTAQFAALAVTVGVTGMAAVGIGLVEQPGELRASADQFVNDRTGAASEAHNTPSVAVDPRQPATLAVANRLDVPELGCALSFSSTGGTSWERAELSPGLAAENCFWPRVAYLPDGTLLVMYTTLGGPNLLPLSVWLQRYVDGRPSGPPVEVAGDLAFHARMAVVGEGVWLTWVQAGPDTVENQLGFEPGDNPVVAARSSDGGRTFSAPVQVSEPDRRVIQPSVVVSSDGRQVTIVALDLGEDVDNYQVIHDGQTPPDLSLRWQVVSWTSGDGGTTFGPTVVVAGDLVVPQLILADLGPTPGLAIDARNGRVYAAWDAGRGDERDCWVAASDDGGRTWSAPVRVGPTAGSQLLPAVGVAPDGRVDVVFYDRSRDPDDLVQEVVAATSADGGRTFRWAAVSDGGTDSRIGLGAQQGVAVQGDNLAVLSRAGGMVVFWADTGRGTLVSPFQDLALAVVDIEAGGGRRWAAVVVGAALLFAAGALLTLARQTRQAGYEAGV